VLTFRPSHLMKDRVAAARRSEGPRMDKSPDAFRTISEVAEVAGDPGPCAAVLGKPLSADPAGQAGRRAALLPPHGCGLLTGIKRLLHDEGMTIRGVQKILREQGVRHVAGLSGDDLSRGRRCRAGRRGEAAGRLDVETDALARSRPNEATAEALRVALRPRCAARGPADLIRFPPNRRTCRPCRSRRRAEIAVPASARTRCATSTAPAGGGACARTARRRGRLQAAAAPTAPRPMPGPAYDPPMGRPRRAAPRRRRRPGPTRSPDDDPAELATLAARLRALPRAALPCDHDALAEICADRIAALTRPSGHRRPPNFVSAGKNALSRLPPARKPVM
jgi:hypothetical protein